MELKTKYQVKLPPIKRRFKKIGRNDPCPCGSKLKTKNCACKDNLDINSTYRIY